MRKKQVWTVPYRESLRPILNDLPKEMIFMLEKQKNYFKTLNLPTYYFLEEYA